MLLATVAVGCVVQKPPQAIPVAGRAAETSQAQALLSKLAQKARTLSSLETEAVMEYSQGAKHVKAREQLTIRRPQSLRIEAYYAFGVALVVASDGTQIQVFEPSKNELFQGHPTAATLNRFAHVPLGPREAVDLLMGLAPDTDADSARLPLSYARRQGSVLIAGWNKSDGSTIELGFADSELALAREHEHNGALRYEVAYGDYRNVGGINVAHRIEASFPPSGTAVKFNYKQAVLNRLFDNARFVLSPPPATRVIDLDRQAG